MESRALMSHTLPSKHTRPEAAYRSCSQSLPLDILWLPRSSFRPAEGELADCVLVVGVSRPKLAAALLSVTLLSLFLTFHVLYDSALYSIQAASMASAASESRKILQSQEGSGRTINHPMALRKRVRPPRPMRRLPQALIIGVRKCGTRALLEMLYLHPMVQKASGEVHFFDRDENYALGLEWYRSKMPLSFKGQITIEKSPSYFVTPEVPERVRAMNASVRLLLIVREPVTRAISDYTQLRSRATPSAPAPPGHPVPDAVKPFEHLAIAPDGSINIAYRPIAISLYHAYLHRWLEVFPREQILVVNGDQLIEDPVPQLRRIEKFLGLEHKIGRRNFYFNETKGFYCLRNDTTDKCLRETKGRKHPRVDPAVVTKLRKFFIQHNQRFYELVGEDLGWPED
ncbi:heparan sulfate glucosamine 3-O-sulfotransferase 5 [Pectinophora gossypiella]|uniref:heparan sulfate glucosamine 3-O-sulfotransferase 5 n=1 Tax=Pectinophora gossypiella TaxID=13191 RepID=UPI00214ECD54|nr:heparan sulfate glucosamine 3-O-sulfotransferase 5 [Pectinophora gossypiella]XP_049866908.1 heparan sulfate glucosamine 3-O-sulfotransferase 5 [Pectinophora gossypiella]